MQLAVQGRQQPVNPASSHQHAARSSCQQGRTASAHTHQFGKKCEHDASSTRKRSLRCYFKYQSRILLEEKDM